MSNLESVHAQDEINLDDLFAEIECEQPSAESVIEIESEALALVAKEEVLASLDDDLDGLFDENDLDESLLSLDDLKLDEELTVEPIEPVKEEKPKAKTKAKVKAKPEPEAETEPTDEAVDVAEEPKQPKPSTKPKQAKSTEPTAPRTTYFNSSKSKVLLDRLGGDTSEIVLEFDDINLPAEELAKRQRAFLALLNNQPATTASGETVQKKVAEKVVILFTMFKQNKGWNEVMYRTFKLLLTDGYIQSGKSGNLVANLLEKPYSKGTANAQAGQMMKMLPLLKVTSEENNGRLEINENSTIVARLRAEYFKDLEPQQEA